jgi:hypothetical protein
MSDIATNLVDANQQIFHSDPSDEAIEAAAGSLNDATTAYTLGACTGLSVCPGQPE